MPYLEKKEHETKAEVLGSNREFVIEKCFLGSLRFFAMVRSGILKEFVGR